MSKAPRIEVPDDFGQVYDNVDPRPYYRALQPLDYRMPEIVARFLRDNLPVLADAFGAGPLRLLDFACGYGAVAALARHDLAMSDLYGLYAGEAQGRGADAEFFARARVPSSGFEIAGLDIARNALGYALSCGLIDTGFDDDLLKGPPGTDLEAYLSRTCIIYESGAVLDVLMPALLALIDAAGKARPWLLFAPRRDVDDRPICDGLAARDYGIEPVNRRPIRYRRSIGMRERELHAAKMRALGRDPTLGFDGDYIVLDLRLARPRDAAGDIPLERFTFAG
jgi:hypothetical protein